MGFKDRNGNTSLRNPGNSAAPFRFACSVVGAVHQVAPIVRIGWRRACVMAFVCVAAQLLLAGASRAASQSSSVVLFGDQNVESLSDSDGSGAAEAFPVVSGTSGSAQSITVYITSKQTLKAALYSSKGSAPGSLLASGSLAPTGTGWQTVTIPSTSVSAGATYWIALLGPVNYRDGNEAG